MDSTGNNMTHKEDERLKELNARISSGGYSALNNRERAELYALRALPQEIDVEPEEEGSEDAEC